MLGEPKADIVNLTIIKVITLWMVTSTTRMYGFSGSFIVSKNA